MFRTSSVIVLTFATHSLAAPTAAVVDGKVVVSDVKSSRGLCVVVAEGTEKDIADRPPISGEWTFADGKAMFAPKYSFQPGTRYRVYRDDWKHDFELPKPKLGTLTKVTRVLPTTTEIPENTLRFYIEFDKPMPRGEVYKYIQVLTEKGDKVEQPFLELDDELWNAEQTRLTLVIDPGRIKKEVKPRLDLGPVFMQANKYTLAISGKWPTLDRRPLGDDVRKPLVVKAPVNEGIDPKKWQISLPVDGRSSLKIAFGRPMDQPLLMRCLWIIGPDRQKVLGDSEPTNQDMGWSFTPSAAWKPGNYSIRVDSVLEDVCGNRIGQPFEIDLLRPAPKAVKAPFIDLSFAVGSR